MLVVCLFVCLTSGLFLLLYLYAGLFDLVVLLLNVQHSPHGLQCAPRLLLLPLRDEPPRTLWHEQEADELYSGRDAAQTQHEPVGRKKSVNVDQASTCGEREVCERRPSINLWGGRNV